MIQLLPIFKNAHVVIIGKGHYKDELINYGLKLGIIKRILVFHSFNLLVKVMNKPYQINYLSMH